MHPGPDTSNQLIKVAIQAVGIEVNDTEHLELAIVFPARGIQSVAKDREGTISRWTRIQLDVTRKDQKDHHCSWSTTCYLITLSPSLSPTESPNRSRWEDLWPVKRTRSGHPTGRTSKVEETERHMWQRDSQHRPQYCRQSVHNWGHPIVISTLGGSQESPKAPSQTPSFHT